MPGVTPFTATQSVSRHNGGDSIEEKAVNVVLPRAAFGRLFYFCEVFRAAG